MVARPEITQSRISHAEDLLNYLKQFIADMIEVGHTYEETEAYIMDKDSGLWLTLRTHRDNEMKLRKA